MDGGGCSLRVGYVVELWRSVVMLLVWVLELFGFGNVYVCVLYVDLMSIMCENWGVCWRLRWIIVDGLFDWL